MPTVTGPDGRKLRFPDGTPPEQVMQVLAEQYPDMGAPAAEPAPSPVEARAPAAPEQVARPVDDMSALERFLAGAGQSVDSSIRGVRQLYNSAVGDDAKLAELNAEEEEHRKLDEALLGTASGRIGQIAGYAGQAAIPGGAVSKGAKALTMATPRAVQLGTALGAEVGIGAGLGAAQPVIEGESRANNVATGAALGGLARVAPAAIGGAARAVGHGTRISPLLTALGAAARRVAGGAEDPAKMAVRADAGKRLGEIASRASLPLADIAKPLAAIGRNYGAALPDAVRAQLKTLQQYAQSGAVMKGPAIAELRTAISREAKEAKGVAQTGLEKLGRTVDEAMQKSLSKAQVRALKQARTEYRTGVAAPKVSRVRVPVNTGIGTSVAINEGPEE